MWPFQVSTKIQDIKDSITKNVHPPKMDLFTDSERQNVDIIRVFGSFPG